MARRHGVRPARRDPRGASGADRWAGLADLARTRRRLVHDTSRDIRELVATLLDELEIPIPALSPEASPWRQEQESPAGLESTLSVWEVTSAPAATGGGFQLQVYVNRVEMTSAGAGLRMDSVRRPRPDQSSRGRFPAAHRPGSRTTRPDGYGP